VCTFEHKGEKVAIARHSLKLNLIAAACGESDLVVWTMSDQKQGMEMKGMKGECSQVQFVDRYLYSGT
jgi:hypothetical protein